MKKVLKAITANQITITGLMLTTMSMQLYRTAALYHVGKLEVNSDSKIYGNFYFKGHDGKLTADG